MHFIEINQLRLAIMISNAVALIALSNLLAPIKTSAIHIVFKPLFR